MLKIAPQLDSDLRFLKLFLREKKTILGKLEVAMHMKEWFLTFAGTVCASATHLR